MCRCIFLDVSAEEGENISTSFFFHVFLLYNVGSCSSECQKREVVYTNEAVYTNDPYDVPLSPRQTGVLGRGLTVWLALGKSGN